jgi:hypothetical protein
MTVLAPIEAATAHPKFGLYLWLAVEGHEQWRPGTRYLAVERHPTHQKDEYCLLKNGGAICIN